MKQQKSLLLFVGFALLTMLAGSTAQAQTASRTFPETGKTVHDPFLGYWQTHGGLAQQGLPITDAYDEPNDADGRTYRTQYFERARFELHPEQTNPRYQILLGLLGKEALLARYPAGRVTAASEVVPGGGSRNFPESGHAVSGLLLSYWDDNGALVQQGFPLTDAFYEVNAADGKRYITQYFERARFEYHPEQSDPRYKVLLGLVGKEIYQRKGSSGSGQVGCQPTKQIFQYALTSNGELASRLGCATDLGYDAANGIHGGYQPFRKGAVLINQSDSRPSYAYGLYPNGRYKRVDYIGNGSRKAGDPPAPGPRTASAWEALGSESLGAATDTEEFGDGAVQHFRNGTLYYVGGGLQKVFAVLPDGDSGSWASYASRP